MYKIIKLKEQELEKYRGEIISVIDSKVEAILRGYSGSIGSIPIYGNQLILTCLVKE